ncbi:hypothetical protein CLU79DRAFT_888348 [Phycomyces nitens]|nr:hypothetical protein CLU79DRAFT_888348 [Phycomyces nitens]
MTSVDESQQLKDRLKKFCADALITYPTDNPQAFKDKAIYATFRDPTETLRGTRESYFTEGRYSRWVPLSKDSRLGDYAALRARHHVVPDPHWKVPSFDRPPPLPQSRGLKLRDVDEIIAEDRLLRGMTEEQRLAYKAAQAAKAVPPPPPKEERRAKSPEKFNPVLDYLNEITQASKKSTKTPLAKQSSSMTAGKRPVSAPKRQDDMVFKKPYPKAPSTEPSKASKSLAGRFPASLRNSLKKQLANMPLEITYVEFTTVQQHLNTKDDPILIRQLSSLEKTKISKKVRRPIMRMHILVHRASKKPPAKKEKIKLRDYNRSLSNDKQTSPSYRDDHKDMDIDTPHGKPPTDFISSMRIPKRKESVVSQETVSRAQKHPRLDVELEEGEMISPSPSPRHNSSPPRSEPSRLEPLRQEPSRQEPSRQESLKQESLRQEASRQEASRQEPSRQESSRLSVSSQQKSKPSEEIALHTTKAPINHESEPLTRRRSPLPPRSSSPVRSQPYQRSQSTSRSAAATTSTSHMPSSPVRKQVERSSSSSRTSNPTSRSTSNGAESSSLPSTKHGESSGATSTSRNTKSTKSSTSNVSSHAGHATDKDQESTTRQHRSVDRSTSTLKPTSSSDITVKSSSSSSKSPAINTAAVASPKIVRPSATKQSSETRDTKMSAKSSRPNATSSVSANASTSTSTSATAVTTTNTTTAVASNTTSATTTNATTAVASNTMSATTTNATTAVASNTTSATTTNATTAVAPATTAATGSTLSATAPDAETPEKFRLFSIMFQKLASAYKHRGDSPTLEILGVIDHIHALLNYVLAFFYHDKIGNESSIDNWDTLHPFCDVILKKLRAKQEMELYGLCLRISALVRFYSFSRRTSIIIHRAKKQKDADKSNEERLISLAKDQEKAYGTLRECEKYLGYHHIIQKFPVTFNDVCTQGKLGSGIVLGGEAGISVEPMFPFAPFSRLHHAAIMGKCIIGEFVKQRELEYNPISNTDDFM